MYIWISYQYHSDTRWCFRQFHPGERKVLGRIFLVSAFLPWLGLVMSCVILDLIRWIFSIISCVNINIIWFIYSDLNLGIQILVICHSLSILPWDFSFPQLNGQFHPHSSSGKSFSNHSATCYLKIASLCQAHGTVAQCRTMKLRGWRRNSSANP